MNKRCSLTMEKVEKMLIMCRDSFPEYTHIHFMMKFGTSEVWFDSKPEITPDPHEFYWFELCVTELPRVIFEKMHRLEKEYPNTDSSLKCEFTSGGDLLYMATYKGEHVIDILYKEFQKLKKWEQEILRELNKNSEIENGV